MAKVSREKIKMFYEAIANDLVIEMQRRVAVDTGHLQGSIIYRIVGDGMEISMPFYGKYVEFGTPPHVIEAKNKQALHWKQGGKDMFARRVNHPGTRPQPFIRPTLRNMGSIIEKNLDVLQ